MLDGFPSLPHLLRMFIKSALYFFQNIFMFPTSNAAFFTVGALILNGATLADLGKVAMHGSALFLVGVTMGQVLARWADVNILCRNIPEVIPVKLTLSPVV